MRRFSTSCLILLILVSMVGCNPVARIKTQERALQLETAVNTYRKLMRWGHFEEAAQYLKVREGEPTLPDFKVMRRFKVTSLNIGEQLVADNQVDARVVAYFEFYDVETGVAVSVRDSQLWWYDEEAKRWYLGSPMINFADYQ